jgi:hypothetical protein
MKARPLPADTALQNQREFVEVKDWHIVQHTLEFKCVGCKLFVPKDLLDPVFTQHYCRPCADN